MNDVEIAIELEIKETDLERRLKLFQQRSHEVQEKRVYFANYTDYACWPEVEVWKFLRARSRVISFHTTRDGFWETVPHQVICVKEN